MGFEGFELISTIRPTVSSHFRPSEHPGLLHELLHGVAGRRRLALFPWRFGGVERAPMSARRGVPRRGQHSPEDIIRYRLLLEFFASFAAGVTTPKLQQIPSKIPKAMGRRLPPLCIRDRVRSRVRLRAQRICPSPCGELRLESR